MQGDLRWRRTARPAARAPERRQPATPSHHPGFVLRLAGPGPPRARPARPPAAGPAARTSWHARPGRRDRSRAGARCRGCTAAPARRPPGAVPACACSVGDLAGTARRHRAARAAGPARRPRSARSLPGGGGRSSSMGKARTSVGPGLTQPALVQLGHGARSTSSNGQLRQRVHAHGVEHVPGQRGQAGLVHRDPDSLATSMLTAVAAPRSLGRSARGPPAGARPRCAARGHARPRGARCRQRCARPEAARVRVVSARRRRRCR